MSGRQGGAGTCAALWRNSRCHEHVCGRRKEIHVSPKSSCYSCCVQRDNCFYLFLICHAQNGNADLREHAILTLHNLLEGNLENQGVVDSIKPTASWDESGMLQDVG